MHALEFILISRKLIGLINPLAILIIVSLASLPIAVAVMLKSNDQMAAPCFIAATIIFVMAYNVGIMLEKRFARH
jgi:hypothetical protein